MNESPILTVALSLILGADFAAAQTRTNQIEPRAGTWKTWVLSSGSELRVPPPPDQAATAAEIAWLRSLDTERNEIAQRHVLHWNAGSPAYRWVEHCINRIVDGRAGAVNMFRMWTYVSMAMYDATIAAWDSKYLYNRPRPSEVDSSLTTMVPTPRSPSYPSEYGAAAGAASEILAYLYPAEAQSLRELAEEATRSRLYARVEFPSDYSAGLQLGTGGCRQGNRARPS